ncbi:uncharacterized protein BO97DRAFT_413704 [Aspergillus homomorphus CBS 101889]|uniref:Uncharacterized protein n=1 Tax=Aspergillus homomorphus (strain CBS 101889) TaxID=1450537 RepID=A0A395I250_ASPHC|nr:hypothetical protein BO97DRAFT_413704 [Aspergillus homomorphus CBS 101889]RAL13258.1 hypothetical protein BO97DRAFT_413704 [Aspergillus homomorphus CBS 101889]
MDPEVPWPPGIPNVDNRVSGGESTSIRASGCVALPVDDHCADTTNAIKRTGPTTIGMAMWMCALLNELTTQWCPLVSFKGEKAYEQLALGEAALGKEEKIWLWALCRMCKKIVPGDVGIEPVRQASDPCFEIGNDTGLSFLLSDSLGLLFAAAKQGHLSNIWK